MRLYAQANLSETKLCAIGWATKESINITSKIKIVILQQNSRTIVQVLQNLKKFQADDCAYRFLLDKGSETASLTYSQLDRQARTIGGMLQSLQADGERVLLIYPNSLEYIAAFFGCLYAGVIAVPTYPPKNNRPDLRIKAIVQDSQAKFVLTTQQILANRESKLAHTPELANLTWLSTDDLAEDFAEEWEEPIINSNSLAFLQYTSGSTGTPKGVMVSHKNLLHNERSIQTKFGHSEETVVVGWLPLFHDMGLVGNVLQPLYLGRPCILMPPVDFLQKPILWLQAISRYQATTSGGPNFAYDLCVRRIKPEKLANLDLSSWQVAFVGAENVRAGTLERFANYFKCCGFRKEAFYPCYGMAETTLLVSGGIKQVQPKICEVEGNALAENSIVFASQSSDRQNIRKFVSVGQSICDQEVIIVDPNTLSKCDPSQIGEIWVSGNSVTKGYWNQLKATEKTFNAYLAGTNEGRFLRTGDLGFLHNDELYITGRMKDIIIIRGRNYYPQDIELVVESSHPALKSNSGAAFSSEIANSEQLVIVQEVERSYLRKLDIGEVVRNIRREVMVQHDIGAHTIVLIKPGSIPKTSSGKIQRYACRRRFLSGSLNVVRDWSENPQWKNEFQYLQSEVKSLLRQVQADK